VLDHFLSWVLDALREQFRPYLAPLWESRGFWRSVALILLALVVLVSILLVKQRHRITAFLRRDEQRQHDRAIFADADALLTEVGLLDTLRTLSSQHAFTRNDLRAMTSLD
jgi:heme exporter protein D